MKTTSLLAYLFFSLSFAQEFAFHSPPTDPHFLVKSNYLFFKSKISLPPKINSAKQKADVDELLQLQKNRTEADCQQAKNEVHGSIFDFLGEEKNLIPMTVKSDFEKFFDKVKNDVDYFVQKLKVDFPRDRPFVYIKNLSPCIPKEVTKSYPSGHSAISATYALVLAEFFPEKKDYFDNRAKSIRDHRVLAGVHHRTDVVTGKELAALIFKKMQENDLYKKEYAQLKEKILKERAR